MAVGQNHWYHFGVGAPLILLYFTGDWDVQWGCGFLTHGHMSEPTKESTLMLPSPVPDQENHGPSAENPNPSSRAQPAARPARGSGAGPGSHCRSTWASHAPVMIQHSGGCKVCAQQHHLLVAREVALKVPRKAILIV